MVSEENWNVRERSSSPTHTSPTRAGVPVTVPQQAGIQQTKLFSHYHGGKICLTGQASSNHNQLKVQEVLKNSMDQGWWTSQSGHWTTPADLLNLLFSVQLICHSSHEMLRMTSRSWLLCTTIGGDKLDQERVSCSMPPSDLSGNLNSGLRNQRPVTLATLHWCPWNILERDTMRNSFCWPILMFYWVTEAFLRPWFILETCHGV